MKIFTFRTFLDGKPWAVQSVKSSTEMQIVGVTRDCQNWEFGPGASYLLLEAESYPAEGPHELVFEFSSGETIRIKTNAVIGPEGELRFYKLPA